MKPLFLKKIAIKLFSDGNKIASRVFIIGSKIK